MIIRLPKQKYSLCSFEIPMMIRPFLPYTIFLAICSIALCECRNTTPYQHVAMATITNHSNSFAAQASLSVPLDTIDTLYAGLTRKKAVVDFYNKRTGQPAWLQNDLGTQHSESLITFIKNTPYYGLSPSRYHWPELKALTDLRSTQSQQRIELLLTDSYIRLHQELKTGTLTAQSILRDSVSISSLEGVLRNGNVVSSLTSQQPDYQSYHSLINSLQHYLDSAATNRKDSIERMNIIQTIAVNLERWRSETVLRENRYAVVNIPSYMVHVIDEPDTILSSRVIVGKPDHPTPELSSLIECFTIYPYWHVPRKISVEEYLPVIQKDTTFISKNHFDVLDRKGNILDPALVPWASYHKNNFPVVLRQREGADNALGLIKFTFDNPYAVYLHDTNAKRLFKSDTRAFSHGCIRMEKAEVFAHYLMTGSLSKQSQFIRRYLDTKTRVVINIPEPMPIFVRYFTAEVVGGSLKVYKDIYGNDTAIRSQWSSGTNCNNLFDQ